MNKNSPDAGELEMPLLEFDEMIDILGIGDENQPKLDKNVCKIIQIFLWKRQKYVQFAKTRLPQVEKYIHFVADGTRIRQEEHFIRTTVIVY